MSSVIPLLVSVAALAASGLVGMAEVAISAVSRARVELMAKEDRPGAGRLLRVLDRRAEHINMLVLVRTVCEVAGAVFAAAFFLGIIPSRGWAFAAAIAAVALVTFMLVGVLSRTQGRKHPYDVSIRCSTVLMIVRRVLGPISSVLIRVGSLLARGQGFRDGPYATEVELREMVDLAQARGGVEASESRMIQNVFDLGETTARQVMVPRPEMIWIEETKTAGQATSLAVRSGHSRIPVIGENTDDIVGVVYLKDLVEKTYHLADAGRSVVVRDVMRPAVFIPDSRLLDDVLRMMQRGRNHLAMLVDEYGGIAGMITMEDILEEIVGEISDEYDDEETQPIEPIADREFRAVARLSLDDLAEYVLQRLGHRVDFDEDTEEQVDTVAGLISYRMGRVPLPGSTVTVGQLRLTAEGGQDRRGRVRVRTVRVELLPEPVEQGEGEAAR